MADENQLPAKPERQLLEAGFTVLPQTWEQLWSYAKSICETDFTPKAFRGNAGAVLAAWQKGAEVGLKPMAALESICVINGVTSIHSNGFWSLVVTHPKCEWFTEVEPSEALKLGYGECTIKRHGNPNPVTRRFTLDMAITAGLVKKEANGTLSGKDNWRYYPGRMLQQRARHLCAQDAIPEAISGLVPADVAADYRELDVTPAKQEPLKLSGGIEKQMKPKKEEAPKDEPANNSESKPSVDESAHVGAAPGTGDNVSAKGKSKPAKAEEPKSAEQAEKSQEEIIAEMELWIEHCSDDEILASPNWLLKNIKNVKGNENQIKVLDPFNARRQSILKARKENPT